MMRIATAFFLIVLTILIAPQASAQSGNALVGLWETEDHEAVVQFYACEESFCGRFYWLKNDTAENPSLDDRNPDPDKKKKPLCGLTFLGGFVPQEENPRHYASGWIYSPRHGGTYSAVLHLTENDRLDVRGYMFFSFLGGGQTWTRLQASPACPLLHDAK